MGYCSPLLSSSSLLKTHAGLSVSCPMCSSWSLYESPHRALTSSYFSGLSVGYHGCRPRSSSQPQLLIIHTTLLPLLSIAELSETCSCLNTLLSWSSLSFCLDCVPLHLQNPPIHQLPSDLDSSPRLLTIPTVRSTP